MKISSTPASEPSEPSEPSELPDDLKRTFVELTKNNPNLLYSVCKGFRQIISETTEPYKTFFDTVYSFIMAIVAKMDTHHQSIQQGKMIACEITLEMKDDWRINRSTFLITMEHGFLKITRKIIFIVNDQLDATEMNLGDHDTDVRKSIISAMINLLESNTRPGTSGELIDPYKNVTITILKLYGDRKSEELVADIVPSNLIKNSPLHGFPTPASYYHDKQFAKKTIFTVDWVFNKPPLTYKVVEQNGGGFRHPRHPVSPQSQYKKYKKTDRKVKVGSAERCVYAGVRGGEYIKVKGEMVPLRAALAPPK